MGWECTGKAYAGMIAVGLTGIDMKAAAAVWGCSSAAPKAWQSGERAKIQENLERITSMMHNTSELDTTTQQRSRKYTKKKCSHELEFPSPPVTTVTFEYRSVFRTDKEQERRYDVCFPQ